MPPNRKIEKYFGGINMFLPFVTVVAEIFSQASVILSGGERAWRRGTCMVNGGGGHAWRRWCVAKGGMHGECGKGGHMW